MDSVRSCIGCGAKKAKGALLRVALDEKGCARLDLAHNSPGRGAYLCGAGCLGMLKRGAIQRAFRGRLKGVDVEVLARMIEAKEGRRP